MKDLNFNTLSPDYMKTCFNNIRQAYQQTYEQLATLPARGIPLSFKTVFTPLIELETRWDTAGTLVWFPKMVHHDKKIRDISETLSIELSQLIITYAERPDVYRVLKAYYETVYPVEKETLHPEQRLFVENAIKSGQRLGLGITDPVKSQCLQDLKKHLIQDCLTFGNNIKNKPTVVTMTKQDLEGLPDNWFQSHQDQRIEPDAYRFPLKYPEYISILTYANNRETRKKAYIAFSQTGGNDNILVLKRILKHRHQYATLLGYASYADYATERTLSGSSDNVISFLKEMQSLFSTQSKQDIAELTRFAIQDGAPSDFSLQRYDIPYYLRKYQDAEFGISQAELKKYFPTKRVIQGMLDIFAHLFGFRFVKVESPSVWHSDVVLYQAFDTKNGADLEQPIGTFYLDLYPREGKYAHVGAHCTIQQRYDLSEMKDLSPAQQYPSAVILANFDKGSCMEWSSVVTIFHEFGHFLHGLCSKNKILGHDGLSIAERDFIEVPSINSEQWLKHEKTLKSITQHEDTGAPLPTSLIKKLIQKEKKFASFHYLRQVSFALLDQYIHRLSLQELENNDLIALHHKLSAQVCHISLPLEDRFPNSFSHLSSGYGGLYYGYFLSRVLVEDLLQHIGDIFDPQRVQAYRQHILEPGARQPVKEILYNFLGRDPDWTYFRKAYQTKQESILNAYKVSQTQSKTKQQVPSQDRSAKNKVDGGIQA